MNIIRVFPTRTEQSPTDEMCYFGMPPYCLPYHDAVHISVLFTWDIPKGQEMKRQWETATDKLVEIGGPAFGGRSEDFVAGRYLKYGVTITSRGCPNNCWFCSVPKREGNLRELEIKPGNIIQDDNLLACSENHIRAVFEMLKSQKAAEFKGGLEAKLLKPWHIKLLKSITIKQMFFAYDTEDDYEPLVEAGKLLLGAGYKNQLRCFNLIGGPGDTFDRAEGRIKKTWRAGFLPFAMLYRDDKGKYDLKWRQFQRQYALPAITKAKLKS